MRLLELTGALAAVVLLHLVVVRLAPGAVEVVDVFLILIVFNALAGNSAAGLAGGLAAGLVQDALSGGPFGLYAFAGTILGYGTARVAQRLVLDNAAAVLAVIVAAVFLQQAIVSALGLLALPEGVLPDPVAVLLRGCASGAVGAGLFALRARWRGRRVGERRRRKPLKLE